MPTGCFYVWKLQVDRLLGYRLLLEVKIVLFSTIPLKKARIPRIFWPNSIVTAKEDQSYKPFLSL